MRKRMRKLPVADSPPIGRKPLRQVLASDFKRNKWCYLMFLPVLAYFILFKLGPMSRMVIAFQDYKILKGISGSRWVEFENFIKFFQLPDFWRLICNTLMLNVWSIVFAFPAPILLALMINELRSSVGRRVVQTVSYMPHFVSLVVVCSIVKSFCSTNGFINQLISFINPGWRSPNLLDVPGYYRTIHIASGIWQECGWGSIIYLATLSNVDQQLYEAACLDGANRLQRIVHVTLPALVPIITIQFIMRTGHLISTGYHKILLLYNPLTYEKADVISTYMYRFGLLGGNYSVGAAVGVFNTVISLVILVSVNRIFRKTENSLW